MISEIVVVLWLILAVVVILWGVFSGRCSDAIHTCWQPATPAEPCEKVSEALESGNLERMLLALDRRCPPDQRSKLLKTVLEEVRKRQDESPGMKKLYTAMAHQCQKESPLLAEFGLEDVLAGLPDADLNGASETAELAHTHQV